MDFGRFITGIFYSLLPKTWWRGWNYASTADFARSGVVCGIAQMLLFGWLTLGRFEQHMIDRSRLVAGAGVGPGTQLWLLAVFILDFLIQPLPLLLVYFTLEGFARGYTAWLHGVVLPSLPFSVATKLQHRNAVAAQEKALGPRVRDLVEEASDGQLRVASCRPKDWTASTTIAYRDDMWELAKEEKVPGTRRFIYYLKKRHSTVAIRALRTYDPAEVLR